MKWCMDCNSKHFQNEFNNWSSGNEKLLNLFKGVQLATNKHWRVLEWIPYDRIEYVKKISSGGFWNDTLAMDPSIDGIMKRKNG